MISEEQFQALRSLADALEQCDSQELKVVHAYSGYNLKYGHEYVRLANYDLDALAVRIAAYRLRKGEKP